MRYEALALLGFAALGACGSCSADAAPTPSAVIAPPPTTAAPTPDAPDAGRAPLPTPPASDAARRRTLLGDGRTLERAGDHAGAIARYEEALAIAPGDTTLLAELGWAQFHAGALEDALTSTEDAYDRAETPREEAMALYNLGRIAESAEHRSTALQFYRRSLALRANATVRARIVALGGTPLADGEVPVESWVRSSLADSGPYPTLEAVCAVLMPQRAGEETQEDEGEDDHASHCTPELEQRVTGARGVLEAGTVSVVGRDMLDDSVATLVARTVAGWFVVAELGSDYYGPSSLNGGELSIPALEIRDVVPGGDLELVVETVNETTWAEWCEGGSESVAEIRVCGVVGAGVGCWLDVVTRREVRSGTWRDGEGWTAGMDEDEAASTCGGIGDDVEEPQTELGDDIDAVAMVVVDEDDDANADTIAVTFDPDGRVSFRGLPSPAALRAPVPLVRLPCLAPQPDPAFACR